VYGIGDVSLFKKINFERNVELNLTFEWIFLASHFLKNLTTLKLKI